MHPAVLAANESPLGPSDAAIEAARSAVANVHLYPDADTVALNEAIAKKHGLNPAWIMCGTGWSGSSKCSAARMRGRAMKC